MRHRGHQVGAVVGLSLAAIVIAAGPGSRGAAAQDEEVIQDPELEGVAPIGEEPEPEAKPEAGDAEGEVAPQAHTLRPPTRLTLELHGRLGIEPRWENAQEEVLAFTQVGLLEIRHRINDELQAAIGARMRYTLAARDSFDPEEDAFRHRVSLLPTAAYLDWSPIPAFRARIGYQVVHLGRFQIFSGTDALALADLRPGPGTPFDEIDVATPAVRLDWDPASWLSLKGVYIPWFRPHYYDTVGTDYSIGKLQGEETERIVRTLEGLIGRSFLPGYASETLRISGPEPTFTHPQGGFRAMIHGPAGELALTTATALDRIGAFGLSSAMRAFLRGEINAEELAADAASNPPVPVEYPRWWLVSVDGTTSLGPVQVGAEVAYQHDRVFYSAAPGQFLLPRQADQMHFGVQAERIEGRRRYVTFEAFTSYVLQTPSDPNRRWFTLARGRIGYGAAVAGHWKILPQLSVQGKALVFHGPTFVAVPRLMWWPWSEQEWFFELGALVVEGPAPSAPRAPGTSIGGVYDGVDELFVGFGYKP